MKRMMDLVVRNARLRWCTEPRDIGIDGGVIRSVGPALEEKGREEIDAAGHLTTSPLCDPHLHLDAALSVGDPRYNESGTLLEGIRIWGERKSGLTRQVIVDNAVEAVLWEFANGVQFIRTHADATDPKLLTVKALLEVKDRVKDLVDIQIVAFPQDGVFTTPDGEKLMRRAMDIGADVVGGIPHNEFTREDGVRDVEFAFALAERHSAMIDIHCDETGDDQSRFVEVMAKLAIAGGMGERVTASHATAMHNYNNDYAFKLLGVAKRAKMNFITNPFDNSVLQNRTDGYPRRRGHTRVDEMTERSVNVCIGHDSIMDPWYPMGKGSMLQAANLLMHTAHMSGFGQIGALFDMITDNSARTLQVEDRYGIAPGRPANLVVFDAENEFDAIRLGSECLFVIRGGAVALRTVPARRSLDFAGFRRDVDFRASVPVGASPGRTPGGR
jgi:cytosine deaminase